MSTLNSHTPIVESPTRAAHWTGLGTGGWTGIWPHEAATQSFAEQLAQGLKTWPGGRDARIELRGQLGAGKTTLVRHLLRAAGVQGRIKSPTYAVVEPHQAAHPEGQDEGAWPIWHFDFYRFNDPHEWEDAGFRDIFAAAGLKLMEWPDKVAGQLPPPDWVIALEVIDQDQRRVHLSAGTERGQIWLQTWLDTCLKPPQPIGPSSGPKALEASDAR